MGMTFALATAAAFDLICAGTMTYTSGLKKVEQPFPIHFRIDLDANRYCDGECKATSPFSRIDPTKLWFFDENEGGTGGAYSSMDVDRQSGRLTALIYKPRIGSSMASTTKIEGQCERAEFSGFPKFDTKF